MIIKNMIIKNAFKYLLNKYPNNDWDWYNISSNPNITISFIKKYFKNILPFFNNLLKNNSNINIKFIKMFKNYIITNKNWEYLSRNPNITFEIVKYFPNKPWDYFNVLRNINPITYDILPFFEEKLTKKHIYIYVLTVIYTMV